MISHLEDMPPILSAEALAEKERFRQFIQKTHGKQRYRLMVAFERRYNEVPHLETHTA